MVKKLLKWISEAFSNSALPSEPKDKFCYWCHSTHCIYPNFDACKNSRFQCEFHPEIKSGVPSFCHRCSYGWESSDTWTKPTIYKPDPNRYDSRWCLNWVCESCDKQDKEREDLWNRQNQDTVEAAKLSFTQEGDGFFYYGQPIEADFVITYESLAPFVTKIHNIAYEFLYNGIDWKHISIREGCVYIHSDKGD